MTSCDLTHSGWALVGIKLLLCKDQAEVSHIILQDVLDLGGVEVRVITLKVLQKQDEHRAKIKFLFNSILLQLYTRRGTKSSFWKKRLFLKKLRELVYYGHINGVFWRVLMLILEVLQFCRSI